jgi:threonine/homoserine/homoserine lactone efflux protein
VYTALGLALGIAVHVTYSLLGIALIISKSIVIFSTIKYLGAGYLIYIGIKSLGAKPANVLENQIITKQEMGKWEAIKTGFLTNVLNPKATLFFLAVFTQVIHTTTPGFVKVLYGVEMSAMTFVWFSFVAAILSHSKIKEKFAKIQHHVERGMGAVLIALGLKVAFSRK